MAIHSDNDEITVERLLREVHWIRSLARHLLTDEHLVDDVVQQTLLAWLTAPPRDADRIRPWIRRVVRNLVGLSIRQRTRRERRERRAAKPDLWVEERQPGELDELKQQIAEAIFALEEPYRSTIIEHFFEERSAREIARRHGLPPNTVLVRLKRALARLKARLDHFYEGRSRSWPLGLLLLVAVQGGVFLEPSELAQVGVDRGGARRSGMRRHLQGGVVLGLILVTLWLVLSHSFARPPGPGTLATHLPEPLTAGAPEVTPGGASGPPVMVPSQEAEASPPLSPDEAVVLVADAGTRKPVPDAVIYLVDFDQSSARTAGGRDLLEFLLAPWGETPVGKTASDGTVSVPRDRLTRAGIAIRVPGYAEYREPARVRSLTDGIHRIFLRPAVPARISVRGADGRPLPGLLVRIGGNSGPPVEQHTDVHGDVLHTMAGAYHHVHIEAPGHAAVNVLAQAPHQIITLEPGRALRGTVVDTRGAPVADCRVEIAAPPRWRGRPGIVWTDADGRFDTFPVADGAVTLTFTHPDHPRLQTRLETWSEMREFTMPEGAYVTGLVHGADGRPVDDGEVTLVPAGPFHARNLNRATIDADGSFRAGPVPPGDYTLLVEHPELASTEEALADLKSLEDRYVQLSLPRGTSIGGRVTTPSGDPVEGVRIQVGRVLGDELRGRTTISDSEGQFTLSGLPPDPPKIRKNLDDIRWSAFEKDARAGLLLEVQRPHDLLEVNGVSVPRYGVIGSRNTFRVAAGDRGIELTLAPPKEQPPLEVELVDETGQPVRTVTNLILIDVRQPESVSTIFGGTTGTPRGLHDREALRDKVVGFWTRSYAIRFLPIDPFATEPHVVTLDAKRTVTFRLRGPHGDPKRGHALLAIPDLKDDRVSVALYLGRTDDNGELAVSWLSAGTYDLGVPLDPSAVTSARAPTTVLPGPEVRRIRAVRVETDGQTIELELPVQ